ncbi:hypothetical protein BgiMline_023098 [Biomphalaria glabrata]|nr:hypothetical protein BgiMline_010902 [Biomphalaria glabrata]KAI8798875.1 hypothetical protein BgiBS90_001178 [Biomphalaria glabrata]
MTFRCIPLCSCSKAAYIVSTLGLIFVILFIPFLRNAVLQPVWPYAWREMGTLDVLALKFFTQNTLAVEPVSSCPVKTEPVVKPSDIDASKVRVYSEVKGAQLRTLEHTRFLPALTAIEKLQLLHTYLVMAEALRLMRVEYFFVQGSLLGVHRHGGIIPWDDDIDITINVTDWKLVRHGLSCIHGYVLAVTEYMHWKFYPVETGYPFIDIFFFTENERFLWAVSSSTSLYLVFPKQDTYPLSTGQYEGIYVPVPKNIDQIVKNRYDFDVCQSRGMDHKTSLVYPWSSISKVPCSSLTYLYQMYNLV